MTSNHLTVESSGIIRNRTKRFAQPRIIRVRASSSVSSKSSISYDSATLPGTGDEVTTKKRKVKGFRFDSTTLLGSKKSNIIQNMNALALAPKKITNSLFFKSPSLHFAYNSSFAQTHSLFIIALIIVVALIKFHISIFFHRHKFRLNE